MGEEEVIQRQAGCDDSIASKRSVDVKQEDRQRMETMDKTTAYKKLQWLPKLADVALPILDVVGTFTLKYFSVLYEIYQIIPMNVIGMLYGLIMCYFGGFFHVTIAAIEAFKMTGSEEVLKYVAQLREDIEEVLRANKEDDKRDDDNDGIPDVKQAQRGRLTAGLPPPPPKLPPPMIPQPLRGIRNQPYGRWPCFFSSSPQERGAGSVSYGSTNAFQNVISTEQLLARKLNLALRVTNPERAIKAIQGIWQGYMGVLIIMKFRFAKVITLAVSIGNNMKPIAQKMFGPILASAIPEECHKWIDPVINYSCKFVAMAIAWWIQRIISTVQSAIQGGLLFTRSLMCFIRDVTPLKLDPDNSYIDEILGWTLAAYGAYFQISSNWHLPWLVDLLLWPAHLLETFLEWSVAWMDATPGGP